MLLVKRFFVLLKKIKSRVMVMPKEKEIGISYLFLKKNSKIAELILKFKKIKAIYNLTL
jgi:hypothetical protein